MIRAGSLLPACFIRWMQIMLHPCYNSGRKAFLKGWISMDIMYQLTAGLFLYFPEDKSEYIPAGITCAVFMIGAFIAMRIILRVSRKEALKTKQLEEEVTRRNQQIKENTQS